jgi:hypothetical protein
MNNTINHFVKSCEVAGKAITFIVLRFPSHKHVVAQAILCVVNCVLILATVLLNGILIFTILKCSKLQDKIPGFLILVQSTVDFAVGFISLPMFTYIRASEIMEIPNNCVVNLISETVVYTMFGFSLAVVCILTLERYMSIIHPVVHRIQFTKRRISVSLLCAIMVMILCSMLLRFASENIYRISGTTFSLVSLAMNTFAYIKIFLTARRKLPFASNIHVNSIPSAQTIKKMKLLRELKLAKSCAFVVFTSCLCFLPAPAAYLYYKEDSLDSRIAHFWTITFGALNSCLNPVIFFWKRPLLRKEALKILKTVFHS